MYLGFSFSWVTLSVWHCASLGEGLCYQSVALVTLLTWSFSVSVVMGCFSLTLRFWSFHSGALSMGSCYFVLLQRRLKSRMTYVTIMMTPQSQELFIEELGLQS